MFITFEGPDGSGKSTQIKFAKEYLENKGFEVVTTRDPGGTSLGIKLREILLNYDGDICSLTEMLIFLADRAQHVEYKIKPLLAQGKIVLCDRYIDSTVAYQGYARGLSVDAAEYMNNIATQNFMPDLTFLFNLPVETTMERVAKQGTKDRLESEMREFHQKVIDGYLDIARRNPDRFRVIDGNKPVEEVSAAVKLALETFIKQNAIIINKLKTR
ncbi:MAG: dTMP kinase [Cyanobacteriota bacterium]